MARSHPCPRADVEGRPYKEKLLYKNYKFTKDKHKAKGDDEHMIKQIAWNAFKQTGNINTYLELKQVLDIEQNIKQIKVEPYEKCKNQGDNNCRT